MEPDAFSSPAEPLSLALPFLIVIVLSTVVFAEAMALAPVIVAGLHELLR
jgi:hypothetical protein